MAFLTRNPLLVQSGCLWQRSAVVIGRASCSCSMPCRKSPGKGNEQPDRQDARSLSTDCTKFQKLTNLAPRGVDFHFDESYLSGSWGDGESQYPLVWLRYNCQCPNCLHPESHGRRLLGRNLQLAPQVKDLAVDRFARNVSVEWSDGHKSLFAFDWLRRRSFDAASIARRKAQLHAYDTRVAWGRSFRPVVMDYDHAVRSDAGLQKLIACLKVYGLVIVENAVGEMEPLKELEERFGYVIPTIYGTFFEVKSKPVSSNLAYTSETLGLHTDLPFYHEMPGIQVLHCVRQTADIEGGENQFADCMFAGRRLRREDNKAFQILKKEMVNFWNYGSDYVSEYHLKTIRPVLTVDENDEVTHIAYNYQVQDSEMALPAERVADWFRAITRLERTFIEEMLHWRLEAGQMVLFDNTRVVHGRSGYRMTSLESERYLRGIYLSWDLVNSHYRRLKERNEGELSSVSEGAERGRTVQ